MDNKEPKFAIGQKFKTRGKHPKLCTVVDILRTYNSNNELVKVCYVSSHQFMGQIMIDSNVSETTIQMGLS